MKTGEACFAFCSPYDQHESVNTFWCLSIIAPTNCIEIKIIAGFSDDMEIYGLRWKLYETVNDMGLT